MALLKLPGHVLSADPQPTVVYYCCVHILRLVGLGCGVEFLPVGVYAQPQEVWVLVSSAVTKRPSPFVKLLGWGEGEEMTYQVYCVIDETFSYYTIQSCPSSN